MVREVTFSWDESEFFENPYRYCPADDAEYEELEELLESEFDLDEFEAEQAAEHHILTLTQQQTVPPLALVVATPPVIAPPKPGPSSPEPRHLAGADWMSLPWIKPTPANRYHLRRNAQ